MQALRDMYSVFNASEKRKIIYLFIGVFVNGLFEIAGIASIAPFMGVVTSPDIIQDNQYLNLVYKYFGFTSDSEFLIALGIGVVLLLVITNIFAAFMVWQLTLFVNLISHHLSVELLRKYLNKPYQFFIKNNTSELGKNVLFEVSRGVQGAVLPALLVMSKAIVILLVTSFLLIINPYLVLIALLFLGGSYLLIYKFLNQKLKKAGELSVTSTSSKYKFVTESLSGIKEVKLYNKEDDFICRYSEQSEIYARCNTRSSIISQLPRYFIETVAFSGIIFLIVFSIKDGKSSQEVIPMVSVFALAAYRLIPALQQVYHGISQIRYNTPVLEVLMRDFNGIVADHNARKVSNLTPVFSTRNYNLSFNNVSFRYQNSNSMILNSLSFSIQSNTTVGIVGLTGSGKTTLINLIMGLITPISGNISVGGVVLNTANMASWQENIGYVPQDIFLIDDTIAKNIIFSSSNTDVDLNKVSYAAKLAGISEFIASLPKAYNTKVGERGIRLSGGQIQRIGIARALYRSPSVIIFDEATSSLDGVTEKILMETIQKISHKKTIIMVAHRLTSVRRCDAIHLIEDGIISESGTYEQLIKQNLSFKKMADSSK